MVTWWEEHPLVEIELAVYPSSAAAAVAFVDETEVHLGPMKKEEGEKGEVDMVALIWEGNPGGSTLEGQLQKKK